jgi:hypothetical protein
MDENRFIELVANSVPTSAAALEGRWGRQSMACIALHTHSERGQSLFGSQRPVQRCNESSGAGQSGIALRLDRHVVAQALISLVATETGSCHSRR